MMIKPVPMDPHILRDLQTYCPGRVAVNVSLAAISRWRVGGLAAAVVDPTTGEETAQVLRRLAQSSIPFFIMGDSTNVLFDSRGFSGVIVRIARQMSKVEISSETVVAEAGIWVPSLAKKTASSGLSGIEHAVGIPGTIGGLVLMNGGSQRKGIGANVTEIECATVKGEIITISAKEAEFSYRASSLQYKPLAITRVTLSLKEQDPAIIRKEMIEILQSRRQKFPKNVPNCGSTFLSSPEMHASVGPPGKVIEVCGLKGLRRGGAEVSALHGNFIINRGGATSDDILWLINHLRREVFSSVGYLMDCEVQFVGYDGSRVAAHVAAEKYAT